MTNSPKKPVESDLVDETILPVAEAEAGAAEPALASDDGVVGNQVDIVRMGVEATNSVELEQFALPLEHADAIKALPIEERAWVVKQLQLSRAKERPDQSADTSRIRAQWLLKITAFLDQLSKAKEVHEVDHLLEYDLSDGMQYYLKKFDLLAFPHYEKIVTDALMHCLAKTNKPTEPSSVWIGAALTIRAKLGIGITFNDAKIPGYSDSWKSAFTSAMQHNNESLAINIANVLGEEVNFREIPNYEALVKKRYYELMLRCHSREDDVLASALGQGIVFSEREQKIVDHMEECLRDVRDFTVVDIFYILKKFEGIHFGADNIKNFKPGVKAAFLHCLKNGRYGVEGAESIKDALGAGIDFDEEIRAGFVYNLDQLIGHEDHWLNRALDIKKTFGTDMDLSAYPECQRAVVHACDKMLASRKWKISYIIGIKDQLGRNMSFSDETVPGYSMVVQEVFLEALRLGDVEDAKAIQDGFGQGLALGPTDLDDYKGAVRDGFVRCIDKKNPEVAKSLTSQFEKGAEIKDKAFLIQRKFISFLHEGEVGHAIKLRNEFPEMGCDREHIPDFDDSFRACLANKLSRASAHHMNDANYLIEALGKGVDILSVLQKLKEDDPRKFIAFAKREHWKAVFGDKAFGQFLEALPKRTDEARNAFTHNAYDRTTAFMDFLCQTGNVSLDDKGFALVTDFIRRFGLARSQNLYKCFYGLSEAMDGTTPPWIAEAGFRNVDDLEARVKAMRQKVYAEDAITDLRDLNPIELELLSVVTGKATHRFDSGRHDLKTIITDFADAHASGEIAGLPEGYKVETIETAEVSIDFDIAPIKADYDALRHEILQSMKQPDSCDSLRERSLGLIDEKITVLKSKGDTQPLMDQILKLEALRKQVMDVQDLDGLMKVLLSTKFMGNKNPFYSIMRQIVFRKIFIKNRSPEAIADMITRLSANNITGQSILEIIGIVDNVVKHHVLNSDADNKENYWGSDTWDAIKATRRDNRMVDVFKLFSPHIGNLREAAKKFNFNETGKTAKVRSIPDRGFVGEMSGYLADVCYTNEYPLLKDRPNLIPHKLVIGQETEAEFFGSYLIFELEEDTGDKVMLVRGFNVPGEASIDVIKFIETTLNNLEATARQRGAKKIVIPGLTGAIGNYPLTNNYLYNRYVAEQQPIKLKEQFAFNSYDLTEQCFVARDID